uniref:WD repeat domain-containing protein 83 n=1 Tax=Sander lucioperca TaxID=283035 RepID=A0A8D0CV30_SANLU
MLPQHLLRTIDCQQGSVRLFASPVERDNITSDGNYLLSCGSDKSLKLWSGSRGTPLKTYSAMDTSSYDNSHLCSCSSDKTVILWTSPQARSHATQGPRRVKSHCVQFNEEATIILSVRSLDGTVRCWDTRSRRFDVSSLKVAQHELLTGQSVDGRVRRYDLRMGQLHVDFISTPSLDSTVRLLDKSTGEMLGEYSGHKMKGYKLDCCLSSKDTHVLSCSEDGHVYFWDLVEGSLSLKLPVGKAVVQSLSFHPTETCLLTAMEGRVQVWGAEPEDTEEDAVAT